MWCKHRQLHLSYMIMLWSTCIIKIYNRPFLTIFRLLPLFHHCTGHFLHVHQASESEISLTTQKCYLLHTLVCCMHKSCPPNKCGVFLNLNLLTLLAAVGFLVVTILSQGHPERNYLSGKKYYIWKKRGQPRQAICNAGDLESFSCKVKPVLKITCTNGSLIFIFTKEDHSSDFI